MSFAVKFGSLEKNMFTVFDGQTSKTAAGVIRFLFVILEIVGLWSVAAGVDLKT